MCLPLIPTFARIWFGLITTPELHYKECTFNDEEGYIVEFAKLKTGDILLRVPHTYNNFMSSDALQIAMCIRYKYYSQIVPNKSVWVAQEDVGWNENETKLYFDHVLSSIPTESRKLNERMLKYISFKPTTRNTPKEKLHYYNDVYFIHQLFLIQNRRMERGFLTKYIERGPQHLEEALHECGMQMIDLDHIKYRLSRTYELSY
jgi:hypothetical protein